MMTPATAAMIKSLIRQAKGALAALDRWIDEEQPVHLAAEHETRPQVKQ